MPLRKTCSKLTALLFGVAVCGSAIAGGGGARAQDLPPDDGAPPEEHGPLVRARLNDLQLEDVDQVLAEDFAIPPPANNGFPIAGRTRSSCSNNFGEPRGGDRLHMGVDCFAPLGTPVVAVEPGTIRYATAGGPFSCVTGGDISGNRVSLRGRSGFVYYYGHLHTIDVAAGQSVQRGQIIGTVGRTGNAACSTPHLHHEMKCGDDGMPFDPYPSMATWQAVNAPFTAPFTTDTVTQLRLPPPACARVLGTAVHLRTSASPGAPHASLAYGINTYLHLLCDFDGDGVDGIVAFDRGAWYIRSTATAGPPESAFSYGVAGYIPVCGDWDGDGDDGIGVYDNGRWYLRVDASPGPPHLAFEYGVAGYIPVVGNWDGAGGDGVGVYVGGDWHLRQTPSPGFPEIAYSYGMPEYEPVTGDWDGDGVDGTGVYVQGDWHLRAVPSPGAPQVAFSYGIRGYWPVVGDFDGDGRDGSGVVAT